MSPETINAKNRRLITADRLAWAAALLTLIASVAGIFVADLYHGPVESMRWMRVTDVVRLLVLLPILVVGLRSGARGSMMGRIAAMGALACIAYLYAQLTLNAQVNVLTFVHIGLVELAFWSILLMFLGVMHITQPASNHTGQSAIT